MVELKRVKSAEQALRSLMDRCAKSEVASGDARRALYRWGVEVSEHDGVITKLLEHRFIDDARYAAAYVREKSRLSNWGVYKIRTGLRAKQINEDIISEAIRELNTDEMTDKLEQILRRRAEKTTAKNSYDLKSKLLRYGASLGYNFSEVSDMIERITANES